MESVDIPDCFVYIRILFEHSSLHKSYNKFPSTESKSKLTKGFSFAFPHQNPLNESATLSHTVYIAYAVLEIVSGKQQSATGQTDLTQ